MEKRNSEYGSQCVLDENVLPYVIKTKQSPCSVCGRNREFLCCKGCAEVGHHQVLLQHVDVENSAPQIFPGVISGFLTRKVVEFQEARINLKEVEVRTSKNTENIQRKTQLITEIAVTRKRIQTLRKLHRLRQENLNLHLKDESKIRKDIKDLHGKIAKAKSRQAFFKKDSDTKKNTISKTNRLLSLTTQNLEKIRSTQVQDLTTYIFPLVESCQHEESDDEHSDNDIQSSSGNLVEKLAAEARRLSFVQGRWIYDQREGPDITRIYITSPRASAPVDGNYADCEAWIRSLSQRHPNLSEHSESSKSLIHVHASKGVSIYAALCLCTHLMHVLRKVLGMHLPYTLHHRSFSNPHITVQEFLWNVHRLNGNILALCVHYGVDLQLINPLHTLSNMQNVIQMCMCNSERRTSVPLPLALVSSLQGALDESSDPIPDDEDDKLEESLSEWELSILEEDWDSLLPVEPTLSSPSVSGSGLSLQSHAQNLVQQSQGLMSSAINWISKGWWNE